MTTKELTRYQQDELASTKRQVQKGLIPKSIAVAILVKGRDIPRALASRHINPLKVKRNAW